jgi:chorismate synthase
MSGSTFGKNFTVTTWGESHGKALGCVVDGCPAGLDLTEEMIQSFMNRRKPGQSEFTTSRGETDQVEILSGVFEGVTTGTPISMVVYNHNQKFKDYEHLKNVYRPGHADYTYDIKYKHRDYQGGGRSSGRETIGRVAAGAIGSLILEELGVELTTFSKTIGPITVPCDAYRFEDISKNPLYMPNLDYAKSAKEFLESVIGNKDSSGGIIECIVKGLPVGIGEPVFDKLDSIIAKAVMSIGAVKGVEFGAGFKVGEMLGSECNDNFFSNRKEKKALELRETSEVCKTTNNSGGVLGGLSDGDALVLRAAIKPTPSIGVIQNTVNKEKENTTLSVSGRHDPIIVPRAVVVVESMVALSLVDLLFQNMHSKLDNLKRIYS